MDRYFSFPQLSSGCLTWNKCQLGPWFPRQNEFTLLRNLLDKQTNKQTKTLISSGIILVCVKGSHHAIHPGLAGELISIRVTNPGIMLRTWTSTGVQGVRDIREVTVVWGVTRRGWGRGVAFPRCKIFDIIEAGWWFDPLYDMFNAKHPHVSAREYVLQEFFHGWKWTTLRILV